MNPATHVLALLSAIFFLSSFAQAETESWTDRIQLSGDLRLRYEQIERDTRETRKRSRYRARLALVADVSDTVKLVFEIASGADNPVSRNVTFDGGFSAEDIGFDLAYVDWTPAEGMHVFGGKMKNPLFRAGNVPLVWDSDLNPDGVAITYSRGLLFGTLGTFFVEEREAASNSLLVAAQVGAKLEMGEISKLTAGVGYFGYSNTIGNVPFHNGAPKGNSVDLPGNYLYEYKDAELFVQFDTRVGGLPLSIYAHWVRNNEVSEQDTGIAYGDTEVCLVAETTDGERLEGCDAIQTLPDWLRSALRAWSRRTRGR